MVASQGERSDWPQVDVSIVTFNSSEHVASLIASLLAQEVDPGCLHVTFLDNASEDDTVAALEAALATEGQHFASCEVLRNPRNVGFGAAHNQALAHGNAPFVFLLNPDTEMYPDCLARLLRQAQRDETDVAAWEARQVPYEHPKHYDPVTQSPPWCSAAALLLRREAFAAVGGFDARFFLYCEDVDLSWRLVHRGWQLRYVPTACVRHKSYRFAGETKPGQFAHTLFGALCLRTRHGTLGDALRGCGLWRRALVRRDVPAGDTLAVLKSGLRYMGALPHFLRNRTPGHHAFFSEFDFAPQRSGAFHEVRPYADIAERPLVSILVRTLGHKAQVRRALRTILQQTYENVEAVVVEDGPATLAQVMESFADSRITYVPLGKRHGRCHAGNVAMATARGVYLGFLDEDDELHADHVEQLVACLAQTNACAAYATAFEVPTEWNEVREIVQEGLPQVVFDRPFTYLELSVRNITPNCAVLFERTLFDQYGGFDPDLDRQEDWNLWLRFACQSGPFAHIQKTTSLYRVPMSPAAREDRQQAMLPYLEAAHRKHSELTLPVTPEDLAQDVQTLLANPADGLGLPHQPKARPATLLQRLARLLGIR